MIEDISYISRHTILSMMSLREQLSEIPELHIMVNQNSVKIFSTQNLDYFLKNYKNITLLYSEKQLKAYSNYSLTSVIGGIFNIDFFKLSGKHYRDLRYVRNRFDKELKVFKQPKRIDDVMSLINIWKTQYGLQKYFRTCHSGYDINFFETIYETEKNNLFCQFFYKDDVLLGYSVISKMELISNVFAYLLRKTIPGYLNKLGLYVDFKTFQNFWNFLGKPFYIHWGASKGTLLKYKSTKFPVFLTNHIYISKFKGLIENVLF